MNYTFFLSTHIIEYCIYQLYVYRLLFSIPFYKYYLNHFQLFKLEDYTSFYNLSITDINKKHPVYNWYHHYNKVKVLTYDYRDYETGYLIQEEMFIASNNKMFFNIFDAIKYEYNIDLIEIDFI